MGRARVHRLAIAAHVEIRRQYGLALPGGSRAHARCRWTNQHAFHRGGNSLVLKRGNQGFSHPQLTDHSFRIQGRVFPEGLCRHPHRLALFGGVGAQGVLNAVAQLSEDAVGNVRRALADKVDPHALGANQPYDLFNLLQQGLRRIAKQQVRLVEEEHQFRLIRVAELGQFLEQFREQPEQKRGIDPGAADQLVRGEDIDHAASLPVALHEVPQGQGGLAEEGAAALALEHQQPAQDGIHRGLGHAVTGPQFPAVLRQVLEYAAQIGQVHQQQSLAVGKLEYQSHHAFLGLVQVEQSRQQLRAKLGNRAAHRCSLLAKQVPEGHRETALLIVGQTDGLDPLVDFGVRRARLAEAGKVTLDVGEEHRHTARREGFGQALQGHGLAGAGGAGNQAVPVGVAGQQADRGLAVAAEQQGVCHLRVPCGIFGPVFYPP